jgi:hypothetical protein
VFDVLNTETGIALTPDTQSLVDAQINNQIVNPLETGTGSDGSTGTPSTFTGTPVVARTASTQYYDSDQWGRLQFA